MNSGNDTSIPDDSRDPFEALAEEFAELIRVGEQPSVDAFANQHPQLADQIRDLFPLIMQFEQPKLESSDSKGLLDNSDPERKHGTDNKARDTHTFTDLKYSDSCGASPRDGIADAELDHVGRYRIQRLIGAGGFGCVYLAFDEQLQRSVAIKMPSDVIRDRIDANEFIREARIVAQLEHPAIVPVYDVGQADDGQVYIVSRYIRGLSLSDRIAERPFSFQEATRIVEQIADGLHFAHSKGLVHRDIKPANILLDDQDAPFLTDFGIALSDQDLVDSIRHAGTPRYMSPEQARGEGHLIDGRSDIFSLGIVLHELLTGVTPFRGKTPQDVMKRIINSQARPLRQFDASIPVELERICLRALAKHASDRYSTAFDFAEDLRAFQSEHHLSDSASRISVNTLNRHTDNTPSTFNLLPPVIPRGLVAFDRNDADFYLQLLPGPIDRMGMPDSVRFWKFLIENRDTDATVRVGTVYGPSGCGKSSLIRAGVLPRLEKTVDSVLVNASGELVERLTETVYRRWPELRSTTDDDPDSSDRLTDAFIQLRRDIAPRSGRKIVVVIDQFEQYLHTARGTERLAAALRHCDGVSLQAILIVRIDYWLGLTRFMQQLEPRQLDASNSRMVDLFDRRHARNVLKSFGRAYHALPTGELAERQNQFLDDAIDQLQLDEKIIAVRLSLFAEMMKDKPWDPSTLKQLGGVEGIGLQFLEETLGQRTANPDVRRHVQAIRGVLSALLPDDSSELKGGIRSARQLQAACGYSHRNNDFAVVRRILDTDLRLITPVDAEDTTSDENTDSVPDRASDTDTASDDPLYQLTHDFLVPAIRDWLTLQQRSTAAGRTRLLLVEHVRLWKRRPTGDLLPSLTAYLAIRSRVPKHAWSHDENQMMNAAGKRHRRRVAIWSAALAACLVVIAYTASAWNRARGRDRAEAYLSSSAEQIHVTLDWLEPHLLQVNPMLKSVDSSDAVRRMRADLALLRSDPTRAGDLAKYMITTDNLTEFQILLQSLRPYRKDVLPLMWSALGEDFNGYQKLNAAVAIGLYDETDDSADRFRPYSSAVVEPLVMRSFSWDHGDQIRPLSDALVPELWDFAVNPSHDFKLQQKALSLLLGYTDAKSAVDFLLESPRRHIAHVLQHIAEQGTDALPVVEQAIAGAKDPRKIAIARLAAFRLGKFNEVLPAFKVSHDPIIRSYVVSLIPLCGVNARLLFEQFESESNPTMLHGLIIGLAECRDSIAPIDLKHWGEAVLRMHRGHKDAGVHGACEYLLRKWNVPNWNKGPSDMATTTPPTENGSWFVNSQGQTLTVVKAGEFVKGSSPEVDPHHLPQEELRTVELNRTVAICTTPVTMAQFNQYANIANSPIYEGFELDAPICHVNWYNAAAYCNWLSKVEGFPPDEWCYLPNNQQAYATGMRVAPNSFKRKGYRLLTEPEWEFACRAGEPPVVNRFYGNADELLSEYAWYKSSDAAEKPQGVGRLKPNQIGLFDMLGNVHEWTNTHRFKEQTPAVRNGMDMLMRGGSYGTELKYVRNACPYFEAAHAVSNLYGFRIARTLEY